MSDNTFVLPAKAAHAFRPGEMIPEDGFTRFVPYFPRLTGESDAAYAARLEAVGLAVVITSEDARDIATYRGLVTEAVTRKLPIAMLTSPISDDPGDVDLATREAAKAAALEAAHRAKP